MFLQLYVSLVFVTFSALIKNDNVLHHIRSNDNEVN